jgi:hypothetical protein
MGADSSAMKPVARFEKSVSERKRPRTFVAKAFSHFFNTLSARLAIADPARAAA